jgi:hypothetical protein
VASRLGLRARKDGNEKCGFPILKHSIQAGGHTIRSVQMSLHVSKHCRYHVDKADIPENPLQDG